MKSWYNIAHGNWEISVVSNHNFTPKPSVNLKIHLVGSHGTGFTKELLIPFVEHISRNIRSTIENHRKVQIFWHLFDSPGHGDTTLPTVLSWNDPNCILARTSLSKKLRPLGRAVANCAAVVIKYLKTRSSSKDLFYGFGHSYGSKGILEAEAICGRLFNGIFAFEPPVFEIHKDSPHHVRLIENVLKQPRAFEGGEQLRAFVQGSKIYGKLDSRVRELYIKHGYRKNRVKCDPKHTAAILQDASYTSIPLIQSSSCTTMLIVTKAFRSSGSSNRKWGLWEVGKFKGTAIVHYEPRWNHITVYQQPSEVAKAAASFFTDQILSHLDMKSKM